MTEPTNVRCICPDNDNVACIHGRLYQPCESELCGGVCEDAGDCLCRAHGSDTGHTTKRQLETVTVEEAPPTAYIAVEVFVDADPAVVTYSGGLVVFAGQVAYRPRAFDKNGNLICDREDWP